MFIGLTFTTNVLTIMNILASDKHNLLEKYTEVQANVKRYYTTGIRAYGTCVYKEERLIDNENHTELFLKK